MNNEHITMNKIMPNEPNLQNDQMNVTSFDKMKYEKKDTWPMWENEPKTNPKRTQSNPILQFMLETSFG